jgi:hypothetical protein
VLTVLSLFLVTAKPLGLLALETVPRWVSIPTLFALLLVILGKGAVLAHREIVDGYVEQLEEKQAALEAQRAAAQTNHEREVVRYEAAMLLHEGNELLVRIQGSPSGTYIFQDPGTWLDRFKAEADDWARAVEAFLEVHKPRLVPVFRSDADMPPPDRGGIQGPRTQWWERWTKQRVKQLEKVIEQL